jgi:hypothetical protein
VRSDRKEIETPDLSDSSFFVMCRSSKQPQHVREEDVVVQGPYAFIGAGEQKILAAKVLDLRTQV